MNDEKEVQYRKEPRSDTSLDHEEPESSSENEAGSETASEEVQPLSNPHMGIKQLFCALIDAQR